MIETKILTINPGSTSTKIAVFSFKDNKHNQIFKKNISHSTEELQKYIKIIDQYQFRAEIIKQELKDNNIDINEFVCIVGRGGLLKPVKSGTFRVNKKMIEDIKSPSTLEHASNLGCLLAYDIAESIGKKAFIVDPVVVDELHDIARISGLKDFPRTSIFHALNQKAIARKCADEHNQQYAELNMIVVHLGGGITIGAHKKGKVVDVNNGLTGEGPFSPERAGGIACFDIVELCFREGMTKGKAKKAIVGKGGIVNYLGTNDMREIEDRVKAGDEEATKVFDAMSYQITKEIGAMAAAVFAGKVDYIVLTGGIAYDKRLVSFIEEKTGFIAPTKVYPGEDEMMALYLGGLRVTQGKEEELLYE